MSVCAVIRDAYGRLSNHKPTPPPCGTVVLSPSMVLQALLSGTPSVRIKRAVQEGVGVPQARLSSKAKGSLCRVSVVTAAHHSQGFLFEEQSADAVVMRGVYRKGEKQQLSKEELGHLKQ